MSSERESLRTSNLVYVWSTKTRITNMSGDHPESSRVAGQVTTCGGRGHIVTAAVQTAQLVIDIV